MMKEQALMTKIYKIVKSELPTTMGNLSFSREIINNISNFKTIANENKDIPKYGLENVCYRTPYLRVSLPEKSKLQNSLRIFKEKIKNRKCETCVCQICCTYEQNLGFI